MKTISFTYRVNELRQVKLNSLTGKSYLNTQDVQRVVDALIDNAYERSKGKKII